MTDDSSDYNDKSPDHYFHCDNTNYRISPDEQYPEAMTIKRLVATATGYKLKVTVKVTNDADWWDEAYIQVYGRDYYGQVSERYVACSPDFHEYIDESDGYYVYELDCGTTFPNNITFWTMFGTAGA